MAATSTPIKLGDLTLTAIGTVSTSLSAASTYAPRVSTSGADDKSSSGANSVIAYKNQRDGIGIKRRLKAEHDTRCWFSTLNLDFEGEIRLWTKIHTANAPEGKTVCHGLFTAVGTLYALWDKVLFKVYEKEDMSLGFESVLTISGFSDPKYTKVASIRYGTSNLVKAVVITGREYYITIDEQSDGTSDLAVKSGATNYNPDLVDLVDYQGQIYGISATGKFYVFSSGNQLAPGSITEPLATLSVDRQVNSLFTAKNPEGTEVIYALTSGGLYAYSSGSYENDKWEFTNLSASSLTFGDVVERHNTSVYINSERDELLRYDLDSNASLTVHGVSRDDGLKDAVSPEITGLHASQQRLFQFISSAPGTEPNVTTTLQVEVGELQTELRGYRKGIGSTTAFGSIPSSGAVHLQGENGEVTGLYWDKYTEPTKPQVVLEIAWDTATPGTHPTGVNRSKEYLRFEHEGNTYLAQMSDMTIGTAVSDYVSYHWYLTALPTVATAVSAEFVTGGETLVEFISSPQRQIRADLFSHSMRGGTAGGHRTAVVHPYTYRNYLLAGTDQGAWSPILVRKSVSQWRAATVSTAFGYNLFFFDDTFRYINISTGFVNPHRPVTDVEYTESGIHEYSEWGFDDISVPKVATKFVIECDIPLGSAIDVTLNFSNNGVLETHSFSVTKIGTNQRIEYDLPSATDKSGVRFDVVQWSLKLTRGLDKKQTPVVKRTQVELRRVLPPKNAYQFTVDTAVSQGGSSSASIIAALRGMQADPERVRLQYEDTDTWVNVTHLFGLENPRTSMMLTCSEA